MVYLSEESVAALCATLDSYSSKPNGIPGLVCAVVNIDGSHILHHASGQRGAGIVQPMRPDDIFWLASCTKLITSIAVMQLVEQKKLSLDDADQVESIIPKLKSVQVLEESPDGSLRLVDKKRRITLRMLLNHTAGFGYTFMNNKLKKWSDPVGMDEFSGQPYDIFEQPLVNQPGERWEYGTNIDWVGLIVEEVSNLSLGAYFKKFIFDPLGVANISFFPNASMKSRLAFMHDRNPDGRINLRQHGHLYRRPLIALGIEDVARTVSSGGAGCFGDAAGYCGEIEILAALLNDGLHKKTGSRILQKATVDDMFTNQIPQFPDFGRQYTPSSKPALILPSTEIYAQPHDQPQGWGLSFFTLIHPSSTGRSAGSGFWSGLANLCWWLDRDREVGGVIFSQILPFGDTEFWQCQGEFEKLLYDSLIQ